MGMDEAVRSAYLMVYVQPGITGLFRVGRIMLQKGVAPCNARSSPT